MIVPALAVFVFFAGSVAALPAPMQSPRSADCREWRQCRQMALDAAERHEYEDVSRPRVADGPDR